jgi:plastocyanin
MVRLIAYSISGIFSLMLLAAPIVVAGGGCVNKNAANDGAFALIDIKDCSFQPTITRVAAGSTVTWKNVDYLPHLISGVGWGSVQGYTGANGEGQLNPGGAFSFTFAKPGLYPYTCYIHPGMSGLVIVGDVDSTTVPANAPVSTVSTGVPARAGSSPTDGMAWVPLAIFGAIAAIVATGVGLSRSRH